MESKAEIFAAYTEVVQALTDTSDLPDGRLSVRFRDGAVVDVGA
jgi:hypothetical protein